MAKNTCIRRGSLIGTKCECKVCLLGKIQLYEQRIKRLSRPYQPISPRQVVPVRGYFRELPYGGNAFWKRNPGLAAVMERIVRQIIAGPKRK